ncbi:MAG: type IV toxin-antitoxin system AbiEi family antitoxin [Rhodoglobus sp.]
MSQRLPHVLSGHDLPLAELLAARLDGELFRVDECFAPVDEIEQPTHRAGALSAILPERLIAEQRSAAWVWGALDTPPARHELCVVAGTRTRSPGVSWMRLREVVIEPGELTTIGGLQLTTPLRTVVDLARFSANFGEAEELIVQRLLHAHGLTRQQCLDDLERRRNLPNKRQALARLTHVEAR